MVARLLCWVGGWSATGVLGLGGGGSGSGFERLFWKLRLRACWCGWEDGVAGDLAVPLSGAEEVPESGVGVDSSLLCLKINCEGWRLSLARPLYEAPMTLERMSEGDLDACSGDRSLCSSNSPSESEKREASSG